jgi:hypothetical protein
MREPIGRGCGEPANQQGLGCETVSKIGSDGDWMTADPICANEASPKKVDLCAPENLGVDELQFGDPTLGAATVRRLTGTRDGVFLAVSAG